MPQSEPQSQLQNQNTLSLEAQKIDPTAGTEVLPDWVSKVAGVLQLTAKLMPNLVAKLMAVVWFKPFMPKQKRHVSQWQAQADKEVPLSKGQAFLFLGDSPTDADTDKRLVVCIHGWRGRGHQMRRFLSPLLEQGFRVAMVNLPAHCDADPNYTDIYQCANLLKEVNEHLGPIDSIVAHSFGSPVTALALGEGLKVNKLAIIAGNFNIHYLLVQYARAFNLEWLVERIDQQIRQLCNRRIFPGSWDELTMETAMKNLQESASVQFWHDPKDTEISIPTNEEIHQFLLTQQHSSQIHEVSNVGHFNILKSQVVIDEVCGYLSQGRH